MSTTVRRAHRDPFFSEFDALVRGVFGPTSAQARRLDFTPPAETGRDGDDVVVRLDLPGLSTDDVTVEVVAGRLVVKGERRDERAADSAGRSIREVRYGSFERTFGLPAHVTADDVTADYDAGVLAIRVSGVYAGAEPTRISVTSRKADAAPVADVESEVASESES